VRKNDENWEMKLLLRANRPSSCEDCGMWNVSRKFFRLTSDLKWFALRSVWTLAITYAGLELFGFKRLLDHIQWIVPITGQCSSVSPDAVRTWTLLFSGVAKRMRLPLKCLGRSLALCWILRLRGLEATVHIGVRKEHDELDAHAWVQFGDCVINDVEDVADRYTPVIPSYWGIVSRL
jgi:transglutaminase superfamily protein